MPVLPLFPALDERAPRVALRVGDETLTYDALARVAGAFATRIAEAGVAPGERVLVWAHPDVASLAALAAAVVSPYVLVPVNPGIGARELAHVMSNARPKLAFSSDPDALQSAQLGVPVLDARALADEEGPLPADGDASRPRLVLYTSGTTGAPKGAVLAARNIAATLDGLADAWQLDARDTLVHALPLFHAHGLVFGWFGALRVGGALCFVPKFSPRAIAEALRGPRARVLYAVPTMYHRLEEAAREDAEVCAALASAKLLVSGSAALPARVHEAITAHTGQRVCERYGLSETLINTAARADGPRRAGYVGTPLPGVEIALVDDARAPIAERDDATFGEVAVRGPNVFLGYLDNPDATRAVLDAQGFFYTGDLGTLSQDGTLRIVGRKATDIIKTGGFKVGAGEVENALLEHPDVQEVAVLGLPDADLGERIVAFIVPRAGSAPSADALIETASALVGRHKRPREVRFVDALPRNAMGKVQKARLREA